MTELDEIIRTIPLGAIVAITGGEKKEPRRTLFYPATFVEKDGHGNDTEHMVICPGCGYPIPVVEIKHLSVLIIAEHGVFGPQGEIDCGYGGESLEIQSELPVPRN